MHTNSNFLPVRRGLDFDHKDRLKGVVREQYLDEDFMQGLKESREKTSWKGEETLRVASVPVALVEQLQHQGIDLMQMDAKELMATLKALGYERFLAYGGTL